MTVKDFCEILQYRYAPNERIITRCITESDVIAMHGSLTSKQIQEFLTQYDRTDIWCEEASEAIMSDIKEGL